MDYREVNHLLWRGGFGPDISRLKELSGLNRDQLVEKLFSSSQKFDPIDIATKPKIRSFNALKNLTQKEREALRKFNLEELIDLNITWTNYLAFSAEQLRERMSLFWHDHFACFVPFSYMMQLHINKIRKHSLGNFRELLFAMSKDPAMLTFLNNLQNRKDQPNENFAREVMELYTLGIGNYTENDIREAARAFTGWAYDEEGEFQLREKIHDDRVKTFLGKTGNFGGEDILNALLENKQTAKYLCRKIYAWFVNDQVDEQRVEQLSDIFYNSGYDISNLMKTIFLSDWFYDVKNIGSKIKSPLDLISGFRRAFGVTFQDEKVLLFMQKILGQVLGHPPNVAGWPDSKSWIDSSTIVFRLKFADTIFTNSEIDFSEKDEAEGIRLGRKFKNFGAKVETVHIEKLLSGLNSKQAKELLISCFIQPENNFAAEMKYEEHKDMMGFIVKLLRTPEYQLC